MVRPHALTVIACLATLFVTGCTSVPPDAGSMPSDPWEKLNRQTYAFNQTVDSYVLEPVARGYTKIVPEPAREGVGNFFGNLREPRNVLNNSLQGKGEGALVSVFRFLINTSFGLGGIFDVAGEVGGQPERPEDFGQTLAVGGTPNGPYFVVPCLGPSTVRDAGGLAVDWGTSPVTYLENDLVSWGMWGLDGVDFRAKMLPATDLLKSAVDPYIMAREGYLSTRRNAVYDGNPPLDLTVDEFEDEEDAEVRK